MKAEYVDHMGSDLLVADDEEEGNWSAGIYFPQELQEVAFGAAMFEEESEDA